jgi:xylulokinase
VLEGVAFAFADGVDVLAEAGARPIRPLLVGGGARSGFWAQTISDVTGLTIELAPGAEAGAALGAARLGMLAAGAEKSICARPPVQREFLPDAARAALHAPRLRRYRALYGAEKSAR